MRKFGRYKALHNFRDQDNMFEVDGRIEVKLFQMWFTLLFLGEDRTYGAESRT
jgi:hypothetical protein